MCKANRKEPHMSVAALSSAGAMAPFTWSIDRLGQRIDTVRREIDDIWHSPLSDRQKVIETSSRDWEIALLQAGQFALGRSMLSIRV